MTIDSIAGKRRGSDLGSRAVGIVQALSRARLRAKGLMLVALVLSLAGGGTRAAVPVVACPWLMGGWHTKLLGGVSDEGADATAADASGCAIYIAGDTWGVIGAGAFGLTDAFLTRYGTTGTVEWSRQIGTATNDVIHGVAVDAQHNVYVVGNTGGQMPNAPEPNAGGSDVFIAKYDASGNQLWIHQFGSTGDDVATGAAIGLSGSVFITGYARGALPGAVYQGGADVLLAKYNQAGSQVFAELYGTPADDFGEAVAIGTGGNVFIAGRTFDDMPRYTDPFFNPDFWHGGEDIFVGKYDFADGHQLWIRQRGTAVDDAASGIATNADDQVFITGYTEFSLDGGQIHGLEDLVVLRYDSNGNWVWTDQRGTIGNDRGTGVTVDASGTPFVAGYTFSAMDGQSYGGGSDTVLLKYGKGGAWRWTRQFGGSGSEMPGGLTVHSDTPFIGGFTSSNSLNGVFGAGGNDAYLVRYSQSGDPI